VIVKHAATIIKTVRVNNSIDRFSLPGLVRSVIVSMVFRFVSYIFDTKTIVKDRIAWEAMYSTIYIPKEASPLYFGSRCPRAIAAYINKPPEARDASKYIGTVKNPPIPRICLNTFIISPIVPNKLGTLLIIITEPIVTRKLAIDHSMAINSLLIISCQVLTGSVNIK